MRRRLIADGFDMCDQTTLLSLLAQKKPHLFTWIAAFKLSNLEERASLLRRELDRDTFICHCRTSQRHAYVLSAL